MNIAFNNPKNASIILIDISLYFIDHRNPMPHFTHIICLKETSFFPKVQLEKSANHINLL